MKESNVIHIFKKTQSKPLFYILGQICIGQIQFLRQVIQTNLLLIICLYIILYLKHAGIIRRHIVLQTAVIRFDSKITIQNIQCFIINTVQIQCTFPFFIVESVQHAIQYFPELFIRLIFIRSRITPEQDLIRSEIFCQHRKINTKTSCQEFFFCLPDRMPLICIDQQKITFPQFIFFRFYLDFKPAIQHIQYLQILVKMCVLHFLCIKLKIHHCPHNFHLLSPEIDNFFTLKSLIDMLQIFNYLDSCDNALLHTVHSERTILVIHTGSDCHIFVLLL